MHKIRVMQDYAHCSCGYTVFTSRGDDIVRDSYIHARANRPSLVEDTRNASPGDFTITDIKEQ